jgi:hypothetical protein
LAACPETYPSWTAVIFTMYLAFVANVKQMKSADATALMVLALLALGGSLYLVYDPLAARAQQFAEDAGRLAHNVRPDTYMEINNFYTSTIYEKGADHPHRCSLAMMPFAREWISILTVTMEQRRRLRISSRALLKSQVET